MAIRTATRQTVRDMESDVAGDCASGWRGPMVVCHMVVVKCPMRVRNQILKNKKGGSPNLAIKLQLRKI
jgi:hypothetical protein